MQIGLIGLGCDIGTNGGVSGPVVHVPERFAKPLGTRGAAAHEAWLARFAAYRSRYPELAEQIDCIQRCDLPARLAH